MVEYLIGLVIGGVIGYFFCSWMVLGKSARPTRADR